ncbi:MAG: lytic transglycosylase domain-containing protein [Streptosporangiales bacterium]|nr:lytic transglycosylase domain-containing protein [Streptosporangiales bacterium]
MKRVTFRRPAFRRRLVFRGRRSAVIGTGVGAAVVAAGACLALMAGAAAPAPDPAAKASPAKAPPASARPPRAAQDASVGPAPQRLIVPDVIASVPGGITAADLAKLRKIPQVRNLLPISGGRVTVGGEPVTLLGASGAKLRPWTPPDTAGDAAVWSHLAAGNLVPAAPTARADGLRPGVKYPVSAAVRTGIRTGPAATLGVAGVGGIVGDAEAARLGLVRNFAVLVNAPAASMTALTGQVRAALGRRSQAIRLAPETVAAGSLPVETHVRISARRPDSYLDLYRQSAARYCPGLSWTVLAAIGQIESGDGANVGPSSAGALGPMQFEPSTWKTWGMAAFGQAGAPDIMNPLDAVPSAARMLCASGAASGGSGLRSAIFAYNHATWYVDEVLALASEYASEFGR